MIQAIIYKFGYKPGLVIQDNKIRDWPYNFPMPTTRELTKLVSDYETATGYLRQRQNAYPSVEEQLDILYHQGYDGWKADIAAIKAKYPKPTDV